MKKQHTTGFFSDSFEFRGIKFHKMSLTTMALLEMLDSPFYSGEGSGVKGMLDFLLIHWLPREKAVALAKNKDKFDMEAYKFGEQFGIEDLQTLQKLIEQSNDEIASVAVEVKDVGKPQ